MKVEQARAITGYLTRVSRARKRGDATEHTYQTFSNAIRNAIRLMQGIDKAIPEWPVD